MAYAYVDRILMDSTAAFKGFSSGWVTEKRRFYDGSTTEAETKPHYSSRRFNLSSKTVSFGESAQ
jgi:hypothetical protein